MLTLVIPNKNRLDPNSLSTQYLIRSLLWQTDKNFKLLVSDGGSENINSLLEMSKNHSFISVISNNIGEEWNKPLLNNIAIKSIGENYILCTDADMLFAPNFIEEVKKNLQKNCMIEARTLYWKDYFAKKVYNGEVDIESDFENAKVGRIKYRSTCGGCQCMHIDGWNRLKGYDEKFIGWGSEDIDLLQRAHSGLLNVKWIGEERKNILLIHQPHGKTREQIKNDLMYQEENKKRMSDKKRKINPNGWGNLNV